MTQQPAYFVGVDGGPHTAAAKDVAFHEALRGTLLRALYVWHPPPLGVLGEAAAVRECRPVLAKTVAGRTATPPRVNPHHEVLRGHPVQILTEASEHALGPFVGTGGQGRSTRMLHPVGHGVPHHDRCPVTTVLA
ncbi:universal stress protein [Streptomyces chromofuscus]|uniref:universal stress protein n=1 Tax=Streptomyces chromofuscus TaxID=42881 RepID=UPI001988B50B|nr:universal stress protein [Streptomyces chromofuscus]GGT01320.1 hypothetical protein GCM10010254_21970 [Streptomyces chromofuscus]